LTLTLLVGATVGDGHATVPDVALFVGACEVWHIAFDSIPLGGIVVKR
jgi:hypothetical protein